MLVLFDFLALVADGRGTSERTLHCNLGFISELIFSNTQFGVSRRVLFRSVNGAYEPKFWPINRDLKVDL